VARTEALLVVVVVPVAAAVVPVVLPPVPVPVPVLPPVVAPPVVWLPVVMEDPVVAAAIVAPVAVVVATAVQTPLILSSGPSGLQPGGYTSVDFAVVQVMESLYVAKERPVFKQDARVLEASSGKPATQVPTGAQNRSTRKVQVESPKALMDHMRGLPTTSGTTEALA